MSFDQNGRDDGSTAAGANIFLFICWAWGTSIEVFLHRNFGNRYLGFQALAVFFLVPVFGLGWEQYDLRPLTYFLPAYLLMLIVARIGVLRRYWRGDSSCHSMYSGWPRLLRPDGAITELRCKRLAEPALVFASGYIVCNFGELPLGVYLMCGAVCLAITVNVDLTVQRMRVQRMNDAVIEQRLLAERFRETQRRF